MPSYNLPGRKLLTCRYWAFGPMCPDIDASGVEACPFAHWDTGRLSDFYDQRGTCVEWSRYGACRWGRSCSYEHRETGYMGLNKGRLELSGLNLRIADAAAKSGFNTWDQVALLDLIWSVRRVAFKHAVNHPRAKTPPSHPIYPDRYRPGNGRDKTQRPIKRGRETQTDDNNNRAQGTLENPIDIDSDSVKQEADFDVKRHKLEHGQKGRHIVKAPAAGALNPTHRSQLTMRGPKDDRSCTAYTPPVRDLNFATPLASFEAPVSDSQRPLFDQSIEEQTRWGLRKVKMSLEENTATIEKCRQTMHALFEIDENLSKNDIFSVLGELRKSLDACTQGALDGIGNVENIEDYLEDSNDGIK